MPTKPTTSEYPACTNSLKRAGPETVATNEGAGFVVCSECFRSLKLVYLHRVTRLPHHMNAESYARYAAALEAVQF